MSPRQLDDGHLSRLDVESGGAASATLPAVLKRLNSRLNLLRSIEATSVERYQATGAEPLDVTGLSGVLADPQIPLDSTWHLTPMDFGPVIGSPSVGHIANGFYGPATWRLDDATFESLGVARVYDGPPATTVELDVWFAMEGATSGWVVLLCPPKALSPSESLLTEGSALATIATVPATAKTLAKVTMTGSLAVNPGQLVWQSIMRRGGNENDTAAGDMHLMAVTVRFK